MPDVVKGGYTCECGWVGNSRQAKYWHKHNTCPLGVDAVPVPVVAPLVAKVPDTAPLPASVAPAEISGLSPKEQFEREHNVIIPDLLGDELAEPADKPLFDGDDPEIPYILILVVVVVIMLVAGVIAFREKILALFGKKKPYLGVPDYVSE